MNVKQKPGRRPLAPSERRRERVTIYLTREEKIQIMNVAKQSGQLESEWARLVVLSALEVRDEECLS